MLISSSQVTPVGRTAVAGSPEDSSGLYRSLPSRPSEIIFAQSATLVDAGCGLELSTCQQCGSSDAYIAVKGRHEEWCNRLLQSLTVVTAAAFLKSGRNYLRVANSSGRNVHRQLRFEMPSKEAGKWRDALIDEMKEATSRQSRRQYTKKKQPSRNGEVLISRLPEIFRFWAALVLACAMAMLRQLCNLIRRAIVRPPWTWVKPA